MGMRSPSSDQRPRPIETEVGGRCQAIPTSPIVRVARDLSGFSRQLILCALGLVVLAIATSGAVTAHAFLVQTAPLAGERLLGTPSEIMLHFSEPVLVQPDGVALHTSAGDPVPLGPAT